MSIRKKIFIIGISRTGSKFYMQVLNSNDSILIAPELLFKHPFKKDLCTHLNKHISVNDFDKITNTIFNLKLKGTYNLVIDNIDKEVFINSFKKNTSLNIYNILETLLQVYSSSRASRHFGAKFPVHYSYTNELLDSIDRSRVLFLTRDPREIYYSDFTKKKREKAGKGNDFPIKGWFLKPAVLLYTIIEWKNSIKTFQKISSQPKYDTRIQLFKYEDILKDQNSVVKNIASFVDIPENTFSLNNMSVVDSSFSKKPELGRWKNKLNWLEKAMFKLLIGRKMNKYGYL